MCLWCGYQVIAPVATNNPDPKEKQDSSPTVVKDLPKTADESVQEDIPAWRQELSQRLQSIKEDREVPVESEQPIPGPLPEAENRSAHPESSIPSQSDTEPVPRTYVPIQVEIQPTERVRTSSAESKAGEVAESPATPPGRKPAEKDRARDLIDSRISRKTERPETPTDAAEYLFRATADLDGNDDWMILLFRTLSGLVDLFVIALSTGMLIIAANIISGIKVLDFLSILHYSVLLLLVYFLYSLFFLLTIGQTIGMMVTKLRVVAGADKKRPQALRILARCFTYLLSTLCLGVGLLWAFIDQEHQCLHDKLTDTRVIPVYNSNL
jgi:uncharacterized RDD family membrane protein YckC